MEDLLDGVPYVSIYLSGKVDVSATTPYIKRVLGECLEEGYRDFLFLLPNDSVVAKGFAEELDALKGEFPNARLIGCSPFGMERWIETGTSVCYYDDFCDVGGKMPRSGVLDAFYVYVMGHTALLICALTPKRYYQSKCVRLAREKGIAAINIRSGAHWDDPLAAPNIEKDIKFRLLLSELTKHIERKDTHFLWDLNEFTAYVESFYNHHYERRYLQEREALAPGDKTKKK